jgi:hypothetical protein
LNPAAAQELKFEDFMPEFGPQTEDTAQTSAQDMVAKVKAMNARMGGKVVKRRVDPS